MTGIFVTKGMRLTIPEFTINIADDGAVTAPPINLHLHFDVCPVWLALAVRHLDDALERKIDRESKWTGKDEDAKACTLELEFESSMQAIMSAATAFDAFYAAVKSTIDIPRATIDGWRRNKTARYKQVAEVIRIAFQLKPKGFEALVGNLREIFRFRDLAVHPPGEISEAIFHPELDVGTEWRFAYFRYTNACMIVKTAVQMLYDLSISKKSKNDKVQHYIDLLRPKVEPILTGMKEHNET